MSTTERADILNELVTAVTERRRKFEPWELKFIKSVKDSFTAYGRLSERQWEVIERIHQGRVNFQRINQAAMANLSALLRRWLPDGRIENGEYVARNPTRADKSPGSFKVNVSTGIWCDFVNKDEWNGGDPISLAAYLFDMKPVEAAEHVASMLGVEARDR